MNEENNSGFLCELQINHKKKYDIPQSEYLIKDNVLKLSIETLQKYNSRNRIEVLTTQLEIDYTASGDKPWSYLIV